MLQLKNISKEYQTGSLVQKALDDVSLNLRDNEFVSILGPSGSGKSTLLNIVGGLDQYDEGDLLINGVSTKKYKDKDWDSYRNHTIGFVFQSYNLISHQSVLSNVELALTISGISKSKRRKRALNALEKVGLKDHVHKKPNQLSGGQMQRVAIARALVNDPKILLADEPTGALDSETSVQVMELLKDVAKDRLVVMVTHNPDLAHKYSTRIVELKDGKIISDSNPYELKKNEKGIHKNFGKASMSLLTSISLSFNNLKTKFKRTLMIAFAGSIGIIGIALILALSNGVNKFIQDTEEETMISYPIQITRSSISLISGMAAFEEDSKKENTGDIRELKTLENMLSMVNQNDLSSLKYHFEHEGKSIYDYSRAIEYSYDITPLIYVRQNDKYQKVNPNETFSPLGLSSSSIMFANSSINSFNKLPKNKSLYQNNYELKYGKWPTNKNECIVVTSYDGNLSDFIFYSLGLRDNEELKKMIENFANNKKNKFNSESVSWKYEDIVGIKFKAISNSYLYSYDNINNVYIDRSEDSQYVESILNTKSTDLKIVGIVTPKDDEDTNLLRMGIWYTDDLVNSIRVDAEKSSVVKAQMKDPKINVLTNGPFGEKQSNKIDFTNMFSIDQNKLANAFKIDQSKLSIDTSSLTNMNFNQYISSIAGSALNSNMIKNINIKVNNENLNKMINNLSNDYLKYASSNPSTDYANLSNAIGEYIMSSEGQQLLSQELTRIIGENGSSLIDSETVTSIVENIMAGYPDFARDHGYVDPSRFNEYLSEYLRSNEAQSIINAELRKLVSKMVSNIELDSNDAKEIATSLEQGYTNYAKKNNLPDPSKMQESLSKYLETNSAKNILTKGINSSINADEIKSQIMKNVSSNKELNKVMNKITKDLAKNIEKTIVKTAKSLPKAISIDTKAFTSAFVINFGEDEIRSFITAMASNSSSSYESNLATFGYVGENELNEIDIYPKDFEAKSSIIDLLDKYNEKVKKDKQPEKEISYIDLVGVMLASVTTIVNVISYVLIAFVAISLVVSSIMIGVITYISVLERRKEIGILRSIGASKRNISQVFNAETGIIGLFAGLLGVGISLLITIPANIILRNVTGIETLTAYLTVPQIITLILISVILTLIGGLIPSKSAAKQDPVEALRTD